MYDSNWLLEDEERSKFPHASLCYAYTAETRTPIRYRFILRYPAPFMRKSHPQSQMNEDLQHLQHPDHVVHCALPAPHASVADLMVPQAGGQGTKSILQVVSTCISASHVMECHVDCGKADLTSAGGQR